MNVITLDPKAKKEDNKKEQLLAVLDEMKERIESGEITEFVAASVNTDGEVTIHCLIDDYLGGVGMFEIGKDILKSISQE